MRIAFCGSSGTGKSVLTEYVSQKYGLEVNPVGARSVSQAMGFDTPYGVDAAGKRSEFQRRLLDEKMAWEASHEKFVTDRTTIDNLAYTAMHGVETIDKSFLDSVFESMKRYQCIVYCPVRAFCDPGGDPARVQDMTYHRLFDATIYGLLLTFRMEQEGSMYPIIRICTETDLDARKRFVDRAVEFPNP